MPIQTKQQPPYYQTLENNYLGYKIIQKTLTNAQILTLPTTPIELLPATTAGQAYLPIAGYIQSNFTAGAYAASLDATLTINIFGQQMSSPMKTNNILTSASQRFARFQFPNSYYGAAAPFTGYVYTALDTTIGNWDQGNLEIQDIFAGVSDYTGGNAANTLKITVYYIIINL